MGSRAVPFLVALAHADQAAVAHVDGNQQFFPGFGGNRALAEDHLLRVDIVVDGSKLFDLSQPHTAQDHIGHGLAVEHGKALCDAHVVDVIFKQLSFYISEILGDSDGMLPAQFIDGALDLLPAACGTVFGNQLIDLVTGAAPHSKAALILVVLADLGAEMPTAGVDYEIQFTILAAVDFYKMVAAAQRTDAALRALNGNIGRAAQPVKVDLTVERVLVLADILPAGDLFTDKRIESGKVDLLFGQPHSLHAAADVYANHAGNDFIPDRHGRADGAALSGVYVRHDTDLAAGKRLLVADGLDLKFSRRLERGRIAKG